MTSLAALPAFLSHFIAGLVLLAIFAIAYVRFTPHNELALIRAGNSCAAVSLGGALIGYALPLGSVVSHSSGLLDAVVWAVVALLAQFGAFSITSRLLLPHWREAMERGEMAVAVLGAAIAIAVGLLNAACLVP
jgi:putative membrane protein